MITLAIPLKAGFASAFRNLFRTKEAKAEYSTIRMLKNDIVVKEMIRENVWEISCLRGKMWITQEGDAVDCILDAGQSILLSRKGRVAVQSLSGGIIRFDRINKKERRKKMEFALRKEPTPSPPVAPVFSRYFLY